MRRIAIGIALFSVALLIPAGLRAGDEQIAQQIMQKLQQHKQAGNLRGFSINMQVEDGTVWLKGYVSSRDQQYLVLDVARRVRGVKQVVNEIDVKSRKAAERQPKAEARNLITGVNSALKELFRPGRALTSAAARQTGIAAGPSSRRTANTASQPQGTGVGRTSMATSRPVAKNTTQQPQKATASAKPTPAARPTPKPTTNRQEQKAEAATKAGQLPLQPAAVAQQGTVQQQRTERATQTRQPTVGSEKPTASEGPATAATASLHQLLEPKAPTPAAQPQVTSRLAVQPQISSRPAEQPQISTPPAAQPQLSTPPAAQPQLSTRPAAQPGTRARVARQPAMPTQYQAMQAGPAPATEAVEIPVQVIPVVPVAPQQPLAFAPARGAAFAQRAQMMAQPPMAGAAPIPAYLPARGGVMTVQHDHPQMPAYAWPSYASHPNYAAVTYPRQYSPSAWPYIGPFYPYPQVPLGWRKVTLKWKDGWWMLDFKDHY